MANQALLNELEETIRTAAKSHGVKGRSLAAIARGCREAPMSPRRAKRNQQLATIEVAILYRLKSLAAFAPASVNAQVASHAEQIRIVIAMIRETALVS